MADLPLATFSPQDQRRVRAALEPGERVVWTGRPVDPPVTAGLVLTIAAGLPFVAFGVALLAGWMGPVSAAGRVFGVVFAVLGLMFAAAPLRARRAARRTIYALTDRHALIFRGQATATAPPIAYDPHDLAGLYVRGGAGTDVGDVVFAEEMRRRAKQVPTKIYHGFTRIAGARAVGRLVRETLNVPERPQ